MKGRIIFPLSILGILLFLIILGSVQMSAKAMVFPWTVGGIGAFLLIWEIVRNSRTSENRIPARDHKSVLRMDLKRYVVNIAMMLAIIPSIYLLGFLVGIPLHVFTFMKMNGEKTLLSLCVAFSAACFIFLVVEIFLGIPVYRGLLFLYFSPD